MNNKQRHIDQLEKLFVLSESWGAQIIVGKIDLDKMSPFCDFVGLDWENWRLYAHMPKQVFSPEEVIGSFIHEMGHLFCSEVDPDHPKCEEYDWLGWEHALARKIGMTDDEWIEGNLEYQIDEYGTCMKHLTHQEFETHKAAWYDTAVEHEFIVDSKPIALRIFEK
jgi:hypothetical protein